MEKSQAEAFEEDFEEDSVSEAVLLTSDGDLRIRELEEQLRQIQSFKEQNERDLQDALRQASGLRDRNQLELQKMKNALRSEWEREVTEDELSRPLDVTYAFLQTHMNDGSQQDRRLDGDIGNHIDSLLRLKEEIARRASLKKKKATYDRDRAELLHQGPLASKSSEEIQRTLDGVIASLDELMLLEERIHSLEVVAEDVKNYAKSRQANSFIKHIVPPVGAPSSSTPGSLAASHLERPGASRSSLFAKSMSTCPASSPTVHPVVRRWLEKKKDLERKRVSRTRRGRQSASVQNFPSAKSRQKEIEEEMKAFDRRREEGGKASTMSTSSMPVRSSSHLSNAHSSAPRTPKAISNASCSGDSCFSISGSESQGGPKGFIISGRGF